MRGRALASCAAGAITGLALLLTPASGHAVTAGDLDSTFDGDGMKQFDVFGGVDDVGEAVAIQPDGKIVVAGSWCGFAAGCDTASFVLARLNPDGSLDASFGVNGRTLITFPGTMAVATGVVIQPDGKIVAAGWADDTDHPRGSDFALARLYPDGELDPGFGDNGQVVTDLGASERGAAVALQHNAFPGDRRLRIVVAGWQARIVGREFAVARYHADGSLDPTFDENGAVTTGILGRTDSAFAVVVQDDGGIVAGGTTGGECAPVCESYFALVRYRGFGGLDTLGFGALGKVVDKLGSSQDEVMDLAIDDRGRIVAAGSSDDFGTDDFVLARYRPDGSRDTSFGSGGVVTTNFGSSGKTGDRIASVVIDAEGMIVAGGVTDAGDGFSDFALARYRVDGSLDPSFSADGILGTNWGVETTDDLEEIAIQPDGKIVVAGTTDFGDDGDRDFALARYHAGTDAGTQPPTTPNDTSVELDIGGGRVGKRRVALRLGCPAAEASPPCAGTVKVRTRKAVRIGYRRRRVVLGKGRFELAAGATKRVRLRLSRRKARLLQASRGARRVRAIATVADAAGNEARVRKGLRLRLRRP